MSDDQPYIELTITVTNLGPPRTSETRYYSNNPVTGRPWTLDDVNRIGVRVVRPKPIPETPRE